MNRCIPPCIHYDHHGMHKSSSIYPSIPLSTCQKVVAVDESKVRARRMGSDTLVDLWVQIKPDRPASGADQIAEVVRWRILDQLPYVSEVLVNVASESTLCPSKSFHSI